jgi:hypothetical protein
VPLDGSARAESVLPIATRLATVHEGELLIAHVTGLFAEPLRPAIVSSGCREAGTECWANKNLADDVNVFVS